MNVSSNTILMVTTAVVSLWMTPYLIGKLGIEVYGVIPLFVSIMAYLGLVKTVLTSAVGRYVSLSYYKGHILKANTYLSSGFWAMTAVSVIIMLLSIAFSHLLGKIFDVPAGYETQVQWLFLLIVGSVLITGLNSLYGMSCFILHKFYWLDLFSILSKFLQVAVIVIGFNCISKSLVFVGWGAVAASLFALLLTASLNLFILPELKINYGKFNYAACRKMIAMGAGVSINEFGALLYLHSDLIVIGILLDSTATGQYGPIVQWTVLIRALSSVVTRSFGPMVMELLAKQDYEALKRYLFTLIKLLGLIIGIPVFLISGFSKPLLSLWLGKEFAGLYKLMILLVLTQIVPYSLGSIFGIFKGLNTLKIPGIVTVIAGIVNIILSVVLIKYTTLGIYGAGIATLIAVFAKGVLFNVVYLSRLMKFNPWKIWSSTISGCSPAVIFTMALLLFSHFIDLNHFAKLLLYGLFFSLVYAVVVFRIVMNKTERLFVVRVLKMDKILSSHLVEMITK